ncbi:hypothetical protein [Streptomyces sp. NPDC058953]|uniref:hypothetical protein n=1 Tax=Streptomyces sp. NPDC058953 TaxID=3346676 RepID=UPI00367965B0
MLEFDDRVAKPSRCALAGEDHVDVVHLAVGKVLDEHPNLAGPEVVQRGCQLVDVSRQALTSAELGFLPFGCAAV